MGILVADVPPKYGMMLSRPWGAKLQGSLQLDMSYATISVVVQPKKLYRGILMKYMVSIVERPRNYPIYSTPTDMDSFILCNSETSVENNTELKQKNKAPENDNIFHESMWHLDFDGSVNKLGAGAGVWIHNLENNHA